MVAASLFITPVQYAMQPAPGCNENAIYGSVADSDGNPAAGVTVKLEEDKRSEATQADHEGNFEFCALHAGKYRLSATKANQNTQVATIVIAQHEDRQRVDLTLGGVTSISPSIGSAPQFGFADNPDFQIAGITDWTAVGGHGSDTTLRTSETLARETLALKPEKGSGPTKESAQRRSADQHRVAGVHDESSGDPLAAAREFKEAVQLDPSEENYFTWGSELLLHRAIWQAQDVFRKGAASYPKSARMLSALGAAFFAGARYDEAAQFLCQASDLDPANPEPYLFMGRVMIAAPDPLPCVERKLSRFAADHPDNSHAIYLYAMAVLKGSAGPAKVQAIEDARKLLAKAVSIDSKCADGYLELGILAASSGDSVSAIGDFNQAIAADPELSEAHYRLGVIYDRLGHAQEARREFAVHDRLEKQQADEVERERRQIKQFVIVTPDDKNRSPQN
jgi:tetratricopeptide (TPR) repeat protein